MKNGILLKSTQQLKTTTLGLTLLTQTIMTGLNSKLKNLECLMILNAILTQNMEQSSHVQKLFEKMKLLKIHQEEKVLKTMFTTYSLNLTRQELIQAFIQNQATFRLKLQDFNLMNGNLSLMISSLNGAKVSQEQSDII